MDPLLKQRLVGIAVLIALAVIFIPMFLTPPAAPLPPVIPRDMAPMPADTLPAEPVPVDPVIVGEVERGLNATPAELAESVAPAAGPTTPLTAQGSAASLPMPRETTVTQVTDLPHAAAPAPGAWIVQLGTFSSEANAKKLQQKLHGAGFAVTITPLEASGKRTFRVRVGRPGARPEAEIIHSQVMAKLGYVGMIVKAN